MSADHGSSDAEAWEQLTLIVIGVAVLGAVFTMATWHKVLGFLVDQNVLVPATQSPALQIPAANGIGLDWPRLAIAAAALVLAVVLAVSAIRRKTDDERNRR